MSTHNHTALTRVVNSTAEESKCKKFLSSRLIYWNKFHKYWLEDEKAKNITKCFIFYEDLLNNLTEGLKRMAHFLGFDVSNEVLDCMRRNSEGKFHRHRTREMEEFFERVMDDKLTDTFKTSYEEVNDLVKLEGLNNCWVTKDISRRLTFQEGEDQSRALRWGNGWHFTHVKRGI